MNRYYESQQLPGLSKDDTHPKSLLALLLQEGQQDSSPLLRVREAPMHPHLTVINNALYRDRSNLAKDDALMTSVQHLCDMRNGHVFGDSAR